MKIKTKYLTGAALDWAVAMLQGYDTAFASAGDVIILREGVTDYFDPHRNWGWGGPIIERESISAVRCDDRYSTARKGFTTAKRIPVWAATMGQHSYETVYGSQGDNWGDSYSIDVDTVTYGPTALIAAMRCYCSFKLGNEVDVPEELLK